MDHGDVADDHEVFLPPVHNGMDFLQDAIDGLTAPMSAKSLKDSVLALQSATEVLLKARLIEADWIQVFTMPANADRAKFEDGDFDSCKIKELFSRLDKIIGVPVPDKARENIWLLAGYRNRLLHFGLTTTAVAIRSRAIPVLDFLTEFVGEQLRPEVGAADAAHIDAVMPGIREGLTQIQALVAERMRRVKPELAAAGDRCVECPGCGHPALVASGDAAVRCLLCGRSYTPEQAADGYAQIVLGLGWRPGEPEEFLVWGCPFCDLPTVVRGMSSARVSDAPADFCFNCARWFTTLTQCEGGCGTLIDRSEEVWLCLSCEHEAFERF